MYLSVLLDGDEIREYQQKEETKRIIKDYFALLYANKLKNLNEITY